MSVNIIEYDGNEIVQMNSARLNDLAEKVLEYMSSTGSCTGSITIGSSNPIGTFTDTVRGGGVGSSNTTILSTTYTLSQVNSTTLTVQDPPYYVGLNSTNPLETVLQENLTSLNNIADYILNRAITVGPFSYYLGTSAPVDGGTWVSLGTLSDTLEGFSVTVNTYHLWKKISNGSYDSVSPIKLINGELLQYSETEILSFAKIVEQRIISTGIGTYALQTTTPVTGTWENSGTIFDTRRLTAPVEYIGQQTFFNIGTTYLGTGEDSYFGVAPQNYAGTTPATFFGTTPATFFGTTPVAYTGITPASYFGFMGIIYYYGPTPANFFGTTTVGYEGTAFGFQYLGVDMEPFTGFGPVTYFEPAPASYQGVTADAFGGYAPAEFVGTTPANFFGFTPTTSFGFTPANYEGVTPANFAGTTPETYIGTNPDSTSYVSDISYVSDQSFYGIAVDSTLENVASVTLWKRIG